MVISVLTRSLREGKTLEDFRAAWQREGRESVEPVTAGMSAPLSR
jgi:hypothetical protein